MCVTDIYVDRYPDGSEAEYRETRLCQYGRPGRPCDTHSTLENTARKIDYGEPTSEFIIRQLNTPPRSSTSSGRPSFEFDDESPRPRMKRHSGDFLVSAFFGDPPRRKTRKEKVVVIDTPRSPLSPRSPRSPRTSRTPQIPQPPPTPPPPAPFPRYWSSSRLPRTPPPYVQDATPRGRPPVIVDGRRQPKRASSVEVHVDRRTSEHRKRSRSRSPSSILSDLRIKDEEQERERRRRRDEREARFVSELERERERRRQEERRALHDAEIRARPAVPNPPLRRQPNIRPVVEQPDRLNDIYGDASLTRGERVIAEAVAERSARGERVIAEAVAERRRWEQKERERESMMRAGVEAVEAEAQRQRLRRRFTVAQAPSRRQRDRVIYDDGTFRYE